MQRVRTRCALRGSSILITCRLQVPPPSAAPPGVAKHVHLGTDQHDCWRAKRDRGDPALWDRIWHFPGRLWPTDVAVTPGETPGHPLHPFCDAMSHPCVSMMFCTPHSKQLYFRLTVVVPPPPPSPPVCDASCHMTPHMDSAGQHKLLGKAFTSSDAECCSQCKQTKGCNTYVRGPDPGPSGPDTCFFLATNRTAVIQRADRSYGCLPAVASEAAG